MTIILVAGIHAVGKSTVCESISAEFCIPHYTASQIIRSERSPQTLVGSKLVNDVDENQRLLIQGVSKLSGNVDILLDGHFTIQQKSDGGIEAINVDVFRKLRVGAVVVFTDDPIKIADRARARDGVAPPVEFLQRHQEAEVKRANQVASALNLPIIMLQAFDNEGLANALRGWGVGAHPPAFSPYS